ncbi:MAG: amylo-alpha-1,6-glucosidase [Candidatus Aquicultorales bacterium]
MGVTINAGKTFLVSDEAGDITGGEHGLYSADMRLLSRYVLTLDGKRPLVLAGRPVNYFTSVHYLSAETHVDKREIEVGSIAVARWREIDADGDLFESIEIENFGMTDNAFTIKFEFDADFIDIFELKAGRPPSGEHPMWGPVDGGVRLWRTFEGVTRGLDIIFTKKAVLDTRSAYFEIALGEGEIWKLGASFKPRFARERGAELRSTGPTVHVRAPERMAGVPQLETDYDDLRHAYDQSVKDLMALQLTGQAVAKGDVVPAAGIPWYVTVFGRDSLITAYQTIPFMPDMAKGVLRTLAKHQGASIEPTTGEQPGKILHEMRFGPLAEMGKLPGVFYGTVDATVLFLIVLSEYYRWSGSLDLVEELLDNAVLALEWIDEFGDLDGDGFIEYSWDPERELAKGGPIEYTWSNFLGRYNQGWKDSWDAIVFSDGSLPNPPIALCEVQGYVFDAKMRMSELFAAMGETGRSDRLMRQALELQRLFEDRFWMEDKRFYALGLDGEKRQIDAIASNAGHLLWSGIVSGKRAQAIADRLTENDMSSGWGIRTMSSKERAYSPMSYHKGSVWPHDNSIIMAGLLRYGILGPARRIVEDFNDALQYFDARTPPELYCGFHREDSFVPIRYPRTNTPQAWATGAVHLMLRTMLGLEPDAPMKQISMYPWLIPGSDTLTIEGLPIAGTVLSFRVARREAGFDVEILHNPGNLRIITPKGLGSRPAA